MNKPNNLDSFNSASPLFSDLADEQAAQVSGGFVSEISLSNNQAQRLLGNSYNSQDLYSLVVFDTNESGTYGFRDDYFINSFSSDVDFVNGSLTLTDDQAIQFGLSDGSNPNLSYGLDLGDNGVIEGFGVASPAIASRSRSR